MAQPPKDAIKTLVINKFNGRLTRFRDGDINSGMANYDTTWGCDTFQLSGNLIFLQGATDITKSVITDMVLAGRIRVESGITYMYALGHTGRLYKIQVNNLATFNPDYDTPVLLTTLSNSQTFKFGYSLDFYKSTTAEKIWIGHDNGITSINFDGTGETNFLSASWVSNVPRQQAQFNGSIYFTNGSNLAQVGTSETVVTYGVLATGFPAEMQARDLRLTADGRFIVTTLTRNQIDDITITSAPTNQIASAPSQIIYWNGTDANYSSSTSFPSFSMTSYFTFSQYEYLFGYQLGGSMLGTPTNVIGVLEFESPPYPNAIGSSGDFMGWAATRWINGFLNAVLEIYGTIDAETPVGMYRQLIMPSSLTGGDVLRVPFFSAVSSFELGGATQGYTTPPYQLYGTGKTYFSTFEYNGSSTKYGFYMFKNASDFLSADGTGVYETQHELFSQQQKPTEVRIYIEPANASCSFQIDLVGIDGNVLSDGNGVRVFSSITGQTRVKYNPNIGATCALGLRITNIGAVTPIIHKVEIDYSPYGN